jgi:threonine aldolase
MLGGGMRQAGVLAAAGIVALETMIDRLAEDHANAKRLAQGLAGIKGIKLAQEEIPTNIVMFHVLPPSSPAEFIQALDGAGVKIGLRDGRPFRAVTNRMVSSMDIEEALTRIEAVCRKLHRARR